MNPDKIKKLKKRCNELLIQNPHMDFADTATLYLNFGININDKAEELSSLDPDTRTKIYYNVTHGWVKYLNEEIGRPVVFDFDLWADSLNFTRDLLAAMGFELDLMPSFVETCQGIFVAMFRMWYEQITIQDIRNFFADKPCPELPDMSDMRKTFLWAIENKIPCNDMASFSNNYKEYLKSRTADEEIESYINMAHLRDAFDACDEALVASGIPQEYLDENRLQLRDVFYAATAYYEMLPRDTVVQELLQEQEKIQRYYEKFLALHKFPGLDPQKLNDENSDNWFYYYIIFVLGLQAGQEVREMEIEIGLSGDSPIITAIEEEMKKKQQK